jgi:hypothetical protein
VRDRWASLLTWCADHIDIPEIATFAHTLDAAVLAGVSNAGSEGANRLQKLDARAAFGYPSNQRCRARVATLRPPDGYTPSHTSSDSGQPDHNASPVRCVDPPSEGCVVWRCGPF